MEDSRQFEPSPKPTELLLNTPVTNKINIPGKEDWYFCHLPQGTLADITFISPSPQEIVARLYLDSEVRQQGGDGDPGEGSSVHHGEGANNAVAAHDSDLEIMICVKGMNDATNDEEYSLSIDSAR